MKQLTLIALIALTIISCKKETPLTFEETILTPKTSTSIELVYPKFKEDSDKATAINTTIKDSICAGLNLNDNKNVVTIQDAVKNFESQYNAFKNEFPDTQLAWEATVDGEVTYQSPQIISVALNTYANAGGAHGNSYINLLNFNAETGKLLTLNNIINDVEGFTKLVNIYFNKTIEDEGNDTGAYFMDGEFTLPEQIGFSDEGLILLYNTYEIASYAQGITEFEIPFSEVDGFLKVR